MTRRAGIPSLVVVAPDGAELVFEARDQLEKLGPAAVAEMAGVVLSRHA